MVHEIFQDVLVGIVVGSLAAVASRSDGFVVIVGLAMILTVFLLTIPMVLFLTYGVIFVRQYYRTGRVSLAADSASRIFVWAGSALICSFVLAGTLYLVPPVAKILGLEDNYLRFRLPLEVYAVGPQIFVGVIFKQILQQILFRTLASTAGDCRAETSACS